MSQLNVGVVGGGVLGKVFSLMALKRGHKVTLFDENSPIFKGSCSQVAAGMLSPFCELVDTSSLISRLGEISLEIWENLVKGLGPSVFFQKQGTIVLSHFRDSNLQKEFKTKIKRKIAGRSNLIEDWDRTSLSQKIPGISSEFREALYLPFEGQIDPISFQKAFQEKYHKEISLYWEDPVEIVSSQKILRKGESFYFDKVVDCRGIRARGELRGLRGVRGELLVLEAPEVTLPTTLRFLHPRYPLYLVPRPHGKILMGATTIEEEDFSPVSVRSMMEFLSAAYCVDKKFAEARILETKVHCRPAFQDNHPRITNDAGVLRINGLYRHGYLISPALCDSVLNEWEGKTPADFWGKVFEVSEERDGN